MVNHLSIHIQRKMQRKRINENTEFVCRLMIDVLFVEDIDIIVYNCVDKYQSIKRRIHIT